MKFVALLLLCAIVAVRADCSSGSANGVVEPGEECDSSSNCLANCTCETGFVSFFGECVNTIDPVCRISLNTTTLLCVDNSTTEAIKVNFSVYIPPGNFNNTLNVTLDTFDGFNTTTELFTGVNVGIPGQIYTNSIVSTKCVDESVNIYDLTYSNGGVGSGVCSDDVAPIIPTPTASPIIPTPTASPTPPATDDNILDIVILVFALIIFILTVLFSLIVLKKVKNYYTTEC